jgi:hypothetical protein
MLQNFYSVPVNTPDVQSVTELTQRNQPLGFGLLSRIDRLAAFTVVQQGAAPPKPFGGPRSCCESHRCRWPSNSSLWPNDELNEL